MKLKGKNQIDRGHSTKIIDITASHRQCLTGTKRVTQCHIGTLVQSKSCIWLIGLFVGRGSAISDCLVVIGNSELSNI